MLLPKNEKSFLERSSVRAGGRPLEPSARRASLGLIVPSVNTVVEPWFNAVVPAGVSIFADRMLLASEVSADSLILMDRQEGMAAATRIATCRPDAIAYCCTASSIVQGLDYDAHLVAELGKQTGRTCFTAVGAIIEALGVFGAKSISIASPYTKVIDEAEKKFFEDAGFRVQGTAHLNISDGFALASPTSAEIYELALRAWQPGADVLLISCLNMNSQYVVSELEQAIGRPVITSTTATLWKLLRTAGVSDRIEGFGRLLQDF
jgi:maleate isomerase